MSGFSINNSRGVQYLLSWVSGASGMTPLINENGKPLISS